jgi:hypothetical protein
MILEAILTCLMNFILGIFELLPNSTLGYDAYSWVDTLLKCLAYFNSFIGVDIFLVAVGHALFFWAIDVTWSVIEWIYKKLPGVD